MKQRKGLMPFGSYHKYPIRSTKKSYLEWLLTMNPAAWLVDKINQELKRRSDQ
jgi:hypothetical protein